MDRGAWWLQSMGSLRVGHDWATSLSLFTLMHWRRKWQPTPVFLPGESQGRQSLVGCCLWGCRVGHDWSDLAAAAANHTGCSEDFPGKNTGLGCHFLLQGAFRPRAQTRVSCIAGGLLSCRQILSTSWATRQAHYDLIWSNHSCNSAISREGHILRSEHEDINISFRGVPNVTEDFPGCSVVRNPPAMQETWVWSLGQEDPLEKEMAPHSCILA